MSERARPLRLLAFAALLGVPVAVVAVIFTSLVHGTQTLVWHDLPSWAGWHQAPWWFVLVVLTAAGGLVAAAERLPGGGGHAALQGFSFELKPPKVIPGIVLAALASLALGPILGPEAPLLALGLAVGAIAGRVARTEGSELQVLAFAGAFAAISVVFGGPLPAALMLFELLSVSGRVPSDKLVPFLLPGFLAAGVGALVFTGVNHWPGVHEASLGLPGLPKYPTVRLLDVAWCAPVAVAVSLLVVACRAGAVRVAKLDVRLGALRLLLAGGFVIGICAVLFHAITGRPVDLVLFSGQTATGTVIAESSVGVLVAIVLAKGVGFAVSAGAGFRGGVVFPVVLMGAAVAVIAASVLPGLDLTPAVVAGVAAAAAAAIRAPFFGALMAALLAGHSATDTAPVAIIAAVISWLVVTALAPKDGAASPEAAGAA